MTDRKNIRRILINVMFIAGLAIVVFPLLLIAQYAYPSADDWSFGTLGYHALKNGEGFFGVIRAAWITVKEYRVSWEGRFSIPLLGALQPGIWGEKYYGVVAWIMIGIVIVSELYLCSSLLKKYAKKEAWWLTIPVIVPSLILQLLYNPAPEESFYWYNGAVCYTFIYGLSLILLALFLKVTTGKSNRRGVYLYRVAAACLLAALVGGGNYSTSLSSCLALCLLSALLFLFDRRAFYRTWFVTVIVGISLLICMTAPGNMVRLDQTFGGVTTGKKQAIMMSLQYALHTVYTESFHIRIALMLLLILPFLWKAVKSMDYSFRFPALFTLITFGLYASQLTPSMYVEKGIHSGRLMAILFYSYHVWLVGNVGYWVGWISRRTNRITETVGRICGRFGRYLPAYCVLMALLFAAEIIRLGGGRSRAAYLSWQQGLPQQYAKEWEERLTVLHDDSVKEVCFPVISVYPAMIMYTDLEPEGGFTWVNSACAQYYDKDKIRVVLPEE